MVQVENESGILRTAGTAARRRSRPGRPRCRPRCWGTWPTTPTGYVPNSPTCGRGRAAGRPAPGRRSSVRIWEAEEVFMAWGFASHAEALAATGKAQKPLPMYANSWLGPQPGQPRAGDYPSGGPASRVLDVWKAAAPSLDLLAPDVYVQDVKSALADYARDDNPLFIPEAQFRTGSLSTPSATTGRSVSACSASRTGGWTARSPRPTRCWARCRTSSRRRRPRIGSRASCSMKNPCDSVARRLRHHRPGQPGSHRFDAARRRCSRAAVAAPRAERDCRRRDPTPACRPTSVRADHRGRTRRVPPRRSRTHRELPPPSKVASNSTTPKRDVS